MICRKCGAEMTEGMLYCEHCGEDVHMVPDFEPELEYSLEQTISGIVEDIKGEEHIDPDPPWSGEEEMPDRPAGKKRSSKKGLILGILLICLIAVLAVAIAVGVYTALDHSIEYQLDRARQYSASTQYDKALTYYERALELEPENVNLKFEIADVWLQKNNKIEYEYLLRDIVRDENADAEQLDSAYRRLITIYRDRGDYETINQLLIASNNENIMSAYQSYLALAPEFSLAEGYYTSIQPLKLTALTSGKIYYTLDGEIPDTDANQYTAPIILEDGDYLVQAVFVNDNGVQSDVVSKEYHIEVEELPIPEVPAVSGQYHYPTEIIVEGDTENIYYTTDGTTPTENSSPYVGPIPMPLGRSSFRFVRLADGKSSQVVTKSYYLELNTEITYTDAEQIATQYAIAQGKIRDEAGHFDDTAARYVYQFQYAANINKVDDFYLLAEILVDAEGNPARTGSFYVVSIYTGELQRLIVDNRGRFELQPIENTATEENSDIEESSDNNSQ